MAAVAVLFGSMGCAPTTKAAPPALGDTALFVGDYSTGDFSQWDVVQNRFYNGSGTDYSPTYAASVIDDPAKGKVARFEVRAGDYPGFPSGDRSEVQSNRVDAEGQTRWYAFSTKFEPGFPQNHADLGWGVVNQWPDASGAGGSPLGFVVNGQNGQLSLVAERMAAPGAYLGKVVLWQTPLDVGAWHDFKMEVTWSASDTSGSVRLWHDGVAQTLTNGNTDYNVRTLIPGGAGVYYKEGYYRQRDIAPTGVIDHTGFRVAARESEL